MIQKGNSKRSCPSCGKEMSGGLTTYIGDPPECAICQGQTVVGGSRLPKQSNLFDDEENCIAESFFEGNPKKNVVHIGCPCPKCSPRC